MRRGWELLEPKLRLCGLEDLVEPLRAPQHHRLSLRGPLKRTEVEADSRPL